MWAADRAWRDSLRAVSLTDLMKTLETDLPAGLLRRGMAWIDAHS
jgi:hypothetical protein